MYKLKGTYSQAQLYRMQQNLVLQFKLGEYWSNQDNSNN